MASVTVDYTLDDIALTADLGTATDEWQQEYVLIPMAHRLAATGYTVQFVAVDNTIVMISPPTTTNL